MLAPSPVVLSADSKVLPVQENTSTVVSNQYPELQPPNYTGKKPRKPYVMTEGRQNALAKANEVRGKKQQREKKIEALYEESIADFKRRKDEIDQALQERIRNLDKEEGEEDAPPTKNTTTIVTDEAVAPSGILKKPKVKEIVQDDPSDEDDSEEEQVIKVVIPSKRKRTNKKQKHVVVREEAKYASEDEDEEAEFDEHAVAKGKETKSQYKQNFKKTKHNTNDYDADDEDVPRQQYFNNRLHNVGRHSGAIFL